MSGLLTEKRIDLSKTAKVNWNAFYQASEHRYSDAIKPQRKGAKPEQSAKRRTNIELCSSEQFEELKEVYTSHMND